MNFRLVDNYVFNDGYIEPRRVKVAPLDSNDDNVPDDPSVFDKVVGTGTILFWELFIDFDGYDHLRPFLIDADKILSTNEAVQAALTVNGDIGFATVTSVFWQRNDADPDGPYLDVSNTYTFNNDGRKDLFFQWKHIADRLQRIDPSISNIIDITALTQNYDQDIRDWLASNGAILDMPKPDQSDQLKVLFSGLNDFKMISDEIIWHPAKYKVLFGSQAREELRARFKVVKIPGTKLSDNEIKSRIITSFNEFFEVNNWTFGEEFFFTELAGFVHQKLAGDVASIVLVPQNQESTFGNLFQVKANADEIFISSARVTDIDIVDNLTTFDLRIGT